MTDIELTHSEEGRGDDLRSEHREAFARQCPALNANGERCAQTTATLHKHPWETR